MVGWPGRSLLFSPLPSQGYIVLFSPAGAGITPPDPTSAYSNPASMWALQPLPR
jgi:hypothetical protein